MKKNKSFIISTTLLWLFLILKITNTVEISWLWVFSPIWLPIVLVILGYIIVILIETFN